LDIVLPLALAFLSFGLIWGLFSDTLWPRVKGLAGWINLKPAQTLAILTYGVPTVLCYTFVERPFRFGLSVGAILLASGFNTLFDTTVSYQDRSFFGVLKVENDRFFRRLVHGTTLHGKQFLDPDGHSIPLTYYHETGPIGHVMAAYNVPDKDNKYPNCAFIGLGTGTMAAYANKDQHVTFYDIDPVVKRIAFDNDKYFTFVEDARKKGAKVDLILGDARLTMERQDLSDDEKYKIVVVDAFSSDAIPIHLITREALKMYLTKITPDGLICFHISNRYLDLKPVLANLARAENLKTLYFSDDDEAEAGKARSTWVVLANNQKALSRLLTKENLKPIQAEWDKPLKMLSGMSWEQSPGPGSFALMLLGALKNTDAPWEPVKTRDDVGVWSDDYSNLLSVFMW
jgi:SAM-dependent methyltransferase